MGKLDMVMSAVATVAAIVAGCFMVLMIGHILLEIVLRSFFARSTYVLDEFVGYAVASMTFLTLAHALNRGSLIRVNLVLDRLEGKTRRAVEIASALAGTTAFAFVLCYFFRSWLRSWNRGTVSGSIAEVPLWIPEGIVLIGLIIFVAQLFVYTLRVILGGQMIQVRTD